MEALKQTVRPKHQVLILKCYPRLPKNSSAAEIKPNGSELSYLLYYASSRRSKLSKVGAFLEKKTVHDLWKYRTASVQITLQILTAFLNDPAIGGAGDTGFGLFAPYILRILREVLRDANEAVLVDSAVPTWDSFCRHQDHVALNADVEFRELFAELVSLWAGYATKEQIQHKTIQRRGKMRVGVTDNVKLRMAGLQALKSTADSETLGTEAGRQLSTVMPVILQNLYDGDGDLDQIMELNAELETQEKEKGVKPQASMMTMREALGKEEDGDARAAGFTVDEADRLADQEASLLALRCMKSVFTFENRNQIWTATNCVLKFIVAHRPNPIKFEKTSQTEDGEDQWAVQLFKAICVWTPVQDRFVAIFAAVEMLIGSNVVEDDLYRQLLLTRIISKLLASDINLIGLSIMDVLLGLLQHILKVLRIGTTQPTSNGSPDDASANDSHHTVDSSQKPMSSAGPVIDTEPRKTPIRVRLLFQLQQCVSNLAIHVYYTDQISDMTTAILLRLKPSLNFTSGSLQVPHNSSITSTGMLSTNGDDTASPAHSEAGITSNSSPRGASSRHLAAAFFFATPTARETALLAIARILTTANRASGPEKNYVSTHRNPVPLNVWEGTTWLLRDPDVAVRSAFIKAFRTWLRFEMPKLSLEQSIQEEKKTERERKRKSLNTDLARRAASTASAKKAASKRNQTAVLQGVHLVVADCLKEEMATFTSDEAQEIPQVLDFNTALSLLSPSGPDFPSTEDAPPTPARTIHLELSALNSELDALSEKLSLLPLDDFRALQVPSVPGLPPSPKTGSSLIPAPPSSSGGIPEEDETERRESGVGSVTNSLHGVNGVRRGSNRSPAPGQAGASAAGKSDRHDFATSGAAEGVRIDELKRILDGEGVRSVSLSRAGEGLSSGLRNGKVRGGEKRSVSLGGRQIAPRGSADGTNTASVSVREDGESDSLVEFEGSWGTSFASPSRSRREKKVDISQLLEGIRVDVREGGGGLGRAPM
ncbi:Protein EFR3 [Sphaceloma murrayae]|uniref:Protein EFR3 n=1 Tax=Sphaceloma murrayae TaxID=2082308 RepID=A0A2K1QGI8_9PEZI|nr:Protein EFR3 [Sphaceloma murrayae]